MLCHRAKRPATVDAEVDAGHICGALERQEGNRIGDVRGAAKPHRDRGDLFGTDLLGADPALSGLCLGEGDHGPVAIQPGRTLSTRTPSGATSVARYLAEQVVGSPTLEKAADG
jgi:hypothetical protein